jgi:hypothetical protein
LINENLEAIEEEIRGEFDEEIGEVEKVAKAKNPLSDPKLSKDKSLPVLLILEDKAHYEKVREIIKEKVTEAKLSKEESTRKKIVVKKLQRAYGLLVEANNARSSDTERTGAPQLISNIEKTLIELKEWANKK